MRDRENTIERKEEKSTNRLKESERDNKKPKYIVQRNINSVMKSIVTLFISSAY
jgi:hypothetical protein